MSHEDHPTQPPFPPGPPAPSQQGQQQGQQQWSGGPAGAGTPTSPQHLGFPPAPGPDVAKTPSGPYGGGSGSFAGPGGPGGPSSPAGPSGPAGPGAPFGPGGPAGPSGPSGPSGPAAWGQPAPGHPGGSRPGGSRTALIATVTGVVGLALGAGIGFLVWGGDDEDGASASSSASASESTDKAEPSESAEPSDGDEPSASASDEPSEDASDPSDDVSTIPPGAPSGRTGEGSSDAPLAFGDEVTTDEWTVTLGAPTDATDAVMAENQFNSPPADGSAFFTLPVTATYLGEGTGVPWIDLTVGFVGDDGVIVIDSCGVVPGDLMDVPDVATGEVAEGNLCVSAPVDADGLWTLTAGWTEEPVFFAAP